MRRGFFGSLGVAVTLLLAQTAEAAPFYRVWRGVGRSDLSRAQVDEAVRSRLAPMTTEVGAGRGLVGYIPGIPRQAAGAADEVALVVYESESAYRSIRTTPQGRAYGDLHWDIFDRQKSGSLVPEDYREEAKLGKAYDLWRRTPDWRAGAVRVTVAQRIEGISDARYIRGIEQFLDKVVSYRPTDGFEALVIGVDAHQFVLFELFTDRDALYDITQSSRYERAYRNLERVTNSPVLAEEAIRQIAADRTEIPTGGAVQVVW